MSLLIINADDFGLTTATSRAILECHRRGVVTSTSVLVPAPAFAATARWLLDTPAMGIGVHLALVGEDRPLLSSAEIPSLVDRRGAFHSSWREFARRAATGRIDAAEVELELAAQIEAVGQIGLPLTHFDSHQHLHQWPSLWPSIQRLAVRAGVSAIRTTRTGGLGPMSLLGRLAARRASRAGLVTTERFAGFSDSGSLSEPALIAALDAVPTSVGSLELGCHPGADLDPDRARYRWGFHWSQESAALQSQRVRQRIERAGHRLGTFADLR